MTSTAEIAEIHQKHLLTAIACIIAAVLSLILFGLTKSYLNSKPLGMQSLYDSCSKICIDCFLVMAFVNFIFMGVFICFWPVYPYVSFALTLVSYFTLITVFVSLFCVQVVRYLYFTYSVVLDYYDEKTTIFYFKQTIFAVSVILTFLEVNVWFMSLGQSVE
jgi:hypothetical protein